MAIANAPRPSPAAPVDVPSLMRALRQHIQAERLNATVWHTTSYSQVDHHYSQHVDIGGVDCDCPAGQQGRTCKHAVLVWALMTGRLVVVHPYHIGHPGPCAARCGGLPIRRVLLNGACLFDLDLHDGCPAQPVAPATVQAQPRKAA